MSVVLECSGCRHWKSEIMFPASRGKGKSKRRRRCKACKKAQMDAWTARNPDRWKETRDPQKHREASKRYWDKNGLKRRYGISKEELEKQILYQDGKCAICGSSPKPLHIDHDHYIDKVRGLLCGQCNKAIGLLGENADRITQAADYVRSGGSWQW